ncbi:spondin domain-containing protein [Anderseniella sp. Alg231-50]|uniref:spondin domain-containing protein n=1 Tax=Anderseniella sp. Alg231-50 TaxID=1922226 RepID=UPI00307C00A4
MIRILAALLLTLGFASSVIAEEAKYELRIDISWSSDTHPYDWPAAGGHMSGLIGATHHGRYVMFADGNTASSGVRSVAERGRPRILRAELDEAIERKRVKDVFQADGIAKVPGKTSVTFPVNETHSKVSFITMIAPSPDWFTGVAGVDLRNDAGWRDEAVYVLWAWDAGTDRGSTYTSDNEANQPAESIRLVASPHFLGDTGLKQVGTATFTRID